jgi:ribosomal protein S25
MPSYLEPHCANCKSVRCTHGKPIRRVHPSELSEKKMGGGKKKLTLKQMEKTQKKQPKKKTKTGSKSTPDTKAAGTTLPDLKREKIIPKLKKMGAITPYGTASRFDVRLSTAREMLKELEKQGTIEYVSGSKNLKIYKLPD